MAGRPNRIRLIGLEFEEVPPERGRTTVDLEWRSQVYTGIAEETASEAGRLRSAARATTDAVGQVLGARSGTLELLDVDTVLAFNAPAVVVALSAAHTGDRVFRGICVVTDEPAVAAVKSVLTATNRLIQHFDNTI